MVENPTVWMRNASGVPLDVQVAKSIATVLPNELIQVYADLGPEQDRVTVATTKGLLPATAAEVDAWLGKRELKLP